MATDLDKFRDDQRTDAEIIALADAEITSKAWLQATNQIGLTGDKAGSFDLTTIGDISGAEGTFTGKCQFGDTATDIHGINTAPYIERMLTSSFSSTATTGITYGNHQTNTHNGVVGFFQILRNIGDYLDLNLQGSQTNFGSSYFGYGRLQEIDDTRTLNAMGGDGHVWGNSNTVGYGGTLTSWATYNQYGTDNVLTGNIAGATNGRKYGTKNRLSGTADNSYAGWFSASGATNNYGIWVDAGNNYMGSGYTYGDKFKITAIGGYAIKLTNNTGSNSVAGETIKASVGTIDAVDATAGGELQCIGVFLDSGIANGSEAWVVVSGIADVKADGTGWGLGDRIVTSATARRGVANNAPAVAVHFQEIGHAVEAAGANATARCVIHLL